MYVAVDIGCLECKLPTELIGVFGSREEAVAACEEYKEAFGGHELDTSRDIRIFAAGALNKTLAPKFREYDLSHDIDDGYEYALRPGRGGSKP